MPGNFKTELETIKPRLSVFISYAHNDSPFSTILIEGLRRNTKNSRNFIWEIWDDSKIGIGTAWDKEIQDKIQDANVAILLISSSFLSSAYIEKSEFGVFLRKVKQANNVLIAPVLLAPCKFSDWEELSEFQFYRPKAGDFGMPERNFSNFSYSDLVKFNQFDGSVIPNSQIERYHLELYIRLENAAEKHFANEVKINQQPKPTVIVADEFNKERNHYIQVISNLEQKITQLTLKIEKAANINSGNQAERENLYNLIAQAKIKEAISKFMEVLNGSDNIQGKNAIILLSARFNELERDNMINIISKDSYLIERNRISNSLLDLISTL